MMTWQLLPLTLIEVHSRVGRLVLRTLLNHIEALVLYIFPFL
jgi:hypothetical protein